MATHTVIFGPQGDQVDVPTGTLLVEAARQANIDLQQPCGGQGRCGRCVVKVEEGAIRQRSSLRLSQEDLDKGYAPACQAVVEGEAHITVPPQEKIERRLTTDRVVGDVQVPAGYEPATAQSIQRIPLSLQPPSMDDQTDDWSRVQRALRQQADIKEVEISPSSLRSMGSALREKDWQATTIVDTRNWRQPEGTARLIDLIPGHPDDDAPMWGLAIDIGTTTVSVWLVNLLSGEVKAQVAEYNQQIGRGEDVISRIIYASKGEGGEEMRGLVLDTINELVKRACLRAQADAGEIVKATIAGNSTMMHLLLNIPAASIRLSPFVTAINHLPILLAKDVGLNIHPQASVDCLPGVASYVGADITAGVLSSGVDSSEEVKLFIDVGTNGEIVLGSRDWLVTCACSAGPAFEGAGVQDGMRATKGAIEEIWINADTYEPSYRVIGGVKARGLCGSGLIALLAELFLTGVLDKGGSFDTSLETPRIRKGEHGAEYVVVWAEESGHGEDIVITHVDVDNLLRAKAAIYAGFTVLADKVAVPLQSAEQVLVGGSFGKYINVEKAVEIGLLPDMPWEQFQFLGNTAIQGAYLALIDFEARQRIQEIAARMTYIELSADNSFYEAFTSASFLPHTDLKHFPSVAEKFEQMKNIQPAEVCAP
ncbi:MAG: DUF4445 domain-containing protein [Chloroflexi bacterium]|nr:MAG: DUF4445 domain-containing protein [Chloroflexota bacterium]MBL1197211.1 DUF4445 domain-containing protein [Chloroflexota bacterium]NOH14505.1 DUF4445 domain-containing protein [Chloroflexota bacterium]